MAQGEASDLRTPTITINMPIRLAIPGSSRRHARTPFVARGVPQVVVESWDWESRCDPEDLRRPPRDGEFNWFEEQLSKRVFFFMPFRRPIPADMHADIPFVRFEREEQWIDDVRPIAILVDVPSDFCVSADSYVTRNLYVMSNRRHTLHYGHQPVLDPQWNMPRAQRDFELRARHKFGMLVPVQCKEVYVIKYNLLVDKFALCPSWWGEIELPFGLRPELPKVVTYFSRRLLGDPHDVLWVVFRAEWAAEASKELLLAARAGRIWWLPPAVRRDIRKIGVAVIYEACQKSVQEDVAALLNFVDRLRWSRCPLQYRILPEVAKRHSQVFVDSGDFFLFDAERWRPLVGPELLLPAKADGSVDGEVDGRGERKFGPTHGMPRWTGHACEVETQSTCVSVGSTAGPVAPSTSVGQVRTAEQAGHGEGEPCAAKRRVAGGPAPAAPVGASVPEATTVAGSVPSAPGECDSVGDTDMPDAAAPVQGDSAKPGLGPATTSVSAAPPGDEESSRATSAVVTGLQALSLPDSISEEKSGAAVARPVAPPGVPPGMPRADAGSTRGDEAAVTGSGVPLASSACASAPAASAPGLRSQAEPKKDRPKRSAASKEAKKRRVREKFEAAGRTEKPSPVAKPKQKARGKRSPVEDS